MLRAVASAQGWHGSQGLGLRHRNWLHNEEPAAPWAWRLCTCCLLQSLKLGRELWGAGVCVLLRLLSALCPEGWAPPSALALPGVVCEPLEHFCIALFTTAGAAFKWVLNEHREQCARFHTCRSGWAVGSHSKDYSQLCLCARGLLEISSLSKDCPWVS